MADPNAAGDLRYEQTLDYLYNRLPLFSRIGAAALKKDLTNTLRLCDALGAPQDQFKAIHVAGTNGKGSTSHALAAVLQQAGYRTGLYTSPHLVDFRERIRIDGVPVAKDFVSDFTARVAPLVEAIEPSFFELTVAMAFVWFAEQDVDIAVIETGLGGRLDSTNVITPVLSVITHIGYDHTDLLGDTLEQIAGEKAGIIKAGIPVVVGRRQPETAPVFESAAREAGAPLVYAPNHWQLQPSTPENSLRSFEAVDAAGQRFDLATDLLGAYQGENLATALTAVGLLSEQGWKLSVPDALAAFRNITRTTGLRGRYEVLQQTPNRIVADVAHNAGGLQAVLRQFAAEGTGQKHLVAGFVRDKDVAAALERFPEDARYYWCNAAIPRALPVAELEAAALSAGLKGTAFESVEAAVKAARAALQPGDSLLITGSFFVVGEALANWEENGIDMTLGHSRSTAS